MLFVLKTEFIHKDHHKPETGIRNVLTGDILVMCLTTKVMAASYVLDNDYT